MTAEEEAAFDSWSKGAAAEASKDVFVVGFRAARFAYEHATHYQGSRANALIADMADGHLHNAYAKLFRDEPHRSPEIRAMKAEIDARDRILKREPGKPA